ncbi:hypothetical protein OROMI_000507 [Orobanche minor]
MWDYLDGSGYILVVQKHQLMVAVGDVQIWDLASCPLDQRIFSIFFSTGELFEAAIWQISEALWSAKFPSVGGKFVYCLRKQFDMTPRLNALLYWPTGKHDKLVSVDEQNLFLWSLDTSKKTAQEICCKIYVQSKESAGPHRISGGVWDPHDANSFALTCDSSIQFWDLRTMKQIQLSTMLDLDTLLPVCTRRTVVDDEDDDDISYDEYAEYVRSLTRPELGKSN